MEMGMKATKSVCENDEPKKTSNADNDKYSIYNYCRDHTAFLIACISALVAVLSFIFDYATTMYNREYLSFWNVDVVYSMQDSTLQLYMVFFAFTVPFICSVISIIMRKTADVYRKNYEHIYIAKKTFREDRKEIRALQKRGRELLKNLKSMKDCPEVYTLRIDLQNGVNEVVEIKKRFKKMKRKARKYSLFLLGQTLPTVILTIIVAVLVFMIFLLNAVDFVWSQAFFGAMILTVILTLFAFFSFVIADCFRIRKKYSWSSNFDELLANFEAPEPDTYPVDKLRFSSPKTLASNINIRMALLLVALSSIVCIFSFAFFGQEIARDKKDFAIYSCEGVDYAIIYNNGESAIMEKAAIEGNDIYIDTNCQRITSARDLQYSIYSFENVFPIEHRVDICEDEEISD